MCNGKCGGGCVVSCVSKTLVIIGGLNWGLIGLGMLLGSVNSWNVVNMLLGSWPMVEGVVYVLVGVAAIMKIFGCKCAKCKAACTACMSGAPEEKVEGQM
jgi:uncharacterized membrane protein YuzA (DUF378 family)